MRFPDPRTVLRHRPPAVLVSAVTAFSGDTLMALGVGDGPWPWPKLLEGAAQAAGLLAGAQEGGLADTAVIADYRDVIVHAATHAGPVRFRAALDRRILHFWRCRIEARAEDGALLLAGTVTLAPASSATP